MKKFKGYALAMGVCMLAAHTSNAQFTYSNDEYNPTSKENFNYSVCQSDKYFFTCGTTFDAEYTRTLDISVTCRDYQGNLIWNRIYDNHQWQDIAGKIAATPDGVVIVGTTGKEDNYGHKDLLVMRLDFNGDIINQASFRYPDDKVNIYGFDVLFEPKDKTFILGGMLDANQDKTREESERNGWIMKLQMDNDQGTYIHWLNRYSTDPDKFGGWYDCVNNLERLERSEYGLVYHATGSITNYRTNATQEQSVMNLLIDFNGNLIWDVPFSSIKPGSLRNRQYERGTDVLFQPEEQKIYLMYHSGEHLSTMFMEVGISGSLGTNMITLPFARQNHVEMNMQWENKDMKNIIIGGIYRNRNYMLNMDRGSYTPNWQRLYDPTFDMGDLLNVNFNYNVKPMDQDAVTGSLMQRFFAPHMIVNNPFYDGNYRFACGITNKSGDKFHNLVFQTFPDGRLTEEDNCVRAVDAWKSGEVKPYEIERGKYFPYKFYQVDFSLEAIKLDRKVRNTCEYITWSANKTTSVENAVVTTSDNISIYPNPANGVLNVDIPSGISVSSLNIVDILGRKQQISHTALNNASVQVTVDQLPQGIYTIQIATAKGTSAIRFVKQ